MTDFASKMLARLIEKGLSSYEETEALVNMKLREQKATALKVSLICPLSGLRMNFPCRATTCDHLQCFDADIFLQLNELNPKQWKCPVCQKAAVFASLRLDGYMMSIVKSPRLQPEVTEVSLEFRVLWDPVLPAEGDENKEVPETRWERGGSSRREPSADI